MDDARDSCEEAGGGVANKEVVQTTPTKNADGIRPASCTPSATRNETKLKVENSSPNLRTPPQARKCTRNKHVRSRTHPAVFGGENTTTGSSLRKMTGAGGKDSLQESKKVDALMMAKFENLNNSDRVKRIRMTSEKIIKSKRVFLIRGGYHRIRKCLRQRGWIEQDYKNSPLTRSTNDGGNSSPKKGAETACCDASSDVDDDSDGDNDGNDAGAVSDEEYSDEEEYCMMSRAVRNCIPNFVWTLKREGVLYRSLSRDSIANHFAKASSFTTKVGLCTNLRNLLWFGDTDPNTFFPRCYRLSCDEEKEAFIDDYRFTAALCILKMLSQQSSAPHPCVGSSLPVQDGKNAPPTSDDIDREEKQSEEAAQLAMKAAEAFLGSQDHNDIEGSQYQLCPKLSDCEWEKVINHFYTFAFENGQLRTSVYMNSRANDLLHEMEQHYPQLHLDGSRNVWIIKPGALSRGRGIMCMDRLAPILELVSSTIVKNEGKWVIQKYIERPLLIYDTKFDIRQWFLVTDWNPLTMWMYKECYFRFSTQKYTLENLDQSIHLCNNCIQKNYSNSELRADALPEENMWDSDTFQDYLRSSGHPTVWVDTIYPGMKQALIHVLQVAQDEIEHRKNSFELYGADFMITSDYQPWLIEINSSPTMQSSTAVTTRLCRQVMEDTLKVVLDRREDKDCNLGGFELAYKQPRHEVPSYVGVQLCVQGSAIPKPRSYTYMKKTTSNCESACNAENSVYVKQVACDNSKSETVRSSNIDMYNSSGCGQDHVKKPTSTSNSTPVSTPSTPVKTGQTGLSSCGNRSHPAGVSIVEINCKLPNSNLRVS